ncbi:coiled-coil domain-containing protein 134-like [Eurosta solidaginis]|uniref:coiled-coil domain-containing protein 134-like n=1 Tax=Eurosta solidaginis TaxID=178769 RepID=UPI003530D412
MDMAKNQKVGYDTVTTLAAPIIDCIDSHKFYVAQILLKTTGRSMRVCTVDNYSINKMHFLNNMVLVLWLNSLQIRGNEDLNEGLHNKGNQESDENKSLLTPGVYAKLFAERRKEQQLIIQKMMKSGNYEKNYKLLKIAYGKIFEIIQEKNVTLNANGYEPVRDGFPQQSTLQDAVTLTLENCCIAAESLIHFPEISYRIFNKQKLSEWKSILNWCNDFVNSMPHIIDEPSVKLMAILLEEINEEQRSADYVNPYYESRKYQETTKPKKQRRKLKRGPSLGGVKKEL